MLLPSSSNSPALRRSNRRLINLNSNRHKFLRHTTNRSTISKCSSSITVNNNTRDMTSRITSMTSLSRTLQPSSRTTLHKAITHNRRPNTMKMLENSSPEEEVVLEEAEAAEVVEVEEATKVVRRESSTDPREPSKRRASKRKALVITTTGTRQEHTDTEASLESNTTPMTEKMVLVEATRDQRNPELERETGEVNSSSTR
jgi:hypothetical protein